MYQLSKSPKTIKALQVTPLDRIFVETDESTVSIGQIYYLMASLRGISIEELTDAIEQNYNRIFRENEQ